jgi:hypothetical protein
MLAVGVEVVVMVVQVVEETLVLLELKIQEVVEVLGLLF